MNNSLYKNLTILMGYGERVVRLGLKPLFHIADLESSPKGLDQAYEIGGRISEFLIIILNKNNVCDKDSYHIYRTNYSIF